MMVVNPPLPFTVQLGVLSYVDSGRRGGGGVVWGVRVHTTTAPTPTTLF
jgi:hypothetical protein